MRPKIPRGANAPKVALGARRGEEAYSDEAMKRKLVEDNLRKDEDTWLTRSSDSKNRPQTQGRPRCLDPGFLVVRILTTCVAISSPFASPPSVRRAGGAQKEGVGEAGEAQEPGVPLPADGQQREEIALKPLS